MLISEAQAMIGKIVDVTHLDRQGSEYTSRTEVFDVGFVAVCGPCLITDLGEIRLDRVKSWTPAAAIKVA